MVLFPNCKINLGLHVVRKRADGYHDIETVFYPIALYDAIEVIKKTNATESVGEPLTPVFNISGINIPGSENNISFKAYSLLKRDFPETITSMEMHLHKTIPVGAGLGGGSSDGAFTLKLLNRLFSLGLSTEQLLNYAMELGSDCPFFIINKPCFATGRGDILEPFVLDLSAYKFVITNPGIHINTAESFSLLTPAEPSKSIKNIIKQPIETWKDELKNDFEEPVFRTQPELELIKKGLYEAGAIYASMTGSGSTVYGIFEKNKKLQLSFPSNYFTRELTGELQQAL